MNLNASDPPVFTRALVCKPAASLVHGLTSAGLGLPDHPLALEQHAAYVSALRSCGLEIIELEADDRYPDSCFVEDTALLTPTCAIITNPGAPSRKGEITAVESALGKLYATLGHIQAPGTAEAGDIMMVGTHFHIGLSQRTNQEGAQQLIHLLWQHGYTGSTIALQQVLHLKTGLAYLEHNNLLVCGEFEDHPAFSSFNRIRIPQEESYAANCIWVNDRVLIPAGFPRAKKLIQDAGYETLEVDVSEFRKLDGGLSCLSLRF